MDLDFRIGDRGQGRGGTPLGVSARHAIAIARFGTLSTLKNYLAKGLGHVFDAHRMADGIHLCFRALAEHCVAQ